MIHRDRNGVARTTIFGVAIEVTADLGRGVSVVRVQRLGLGSLFGRLPKRADGIRWHRWPRMKAVVIAPYVVTMVKQYARIEVLPGSAGSQRLALAVAWELHAKYRIRSAVPFTTERRAWWGKKAEYKIRRSQWL